MRQFSSVQFSERLYSHLRPQPPAKSVGASAKCLMGTCILVPAFTQIQSTMPSPTCPSLANFCLDRWIDIHPVCQYCLSLFRYCFPPWMLGLMSQHDSDPGETPLGALVISGCRSWFLLTWHHLMPPSLTLYRAPPPDLAFRPGGPGASLSWLVSTDCKCLFLSSGTSA